MFGRQKQRIAIARAMLKDCHLLLIDEATSALDVGSEMIIQDALDQASDKCTTIMVSHHLSTINNTEMIVVVQGGHMIKTGGHSLDEIFEGPNMRDHSLIARSLSMYNRSRN
jgi:ABC-type bacteriocin/lantibiotic exporter with double-glycine peptidase domain